MASKTSETHDAPQSAPSIVEDVNYASKFHPDVQRGAVGGLDNAKPVFDLSVLASVPPLSESSRSIDVDSTIEEVDEDAIKDEEDDELDASHPFVVNGSGDPTQNKYPHPSLGQLATNGLQGSSEVLTASLIEIRKHPAKLNEPSIKPKLLLSALPPALQDFHRTKSSSTSTLFLNTTIKAPNNDEIIRCMSATLYWNIQKFEGMAKKRINAVFSEEKYPLTEDAELKNPPSQEMVYDFLSAIFTAEQLSAECGVMAMAYVDRLQALTGISIVTSTWRRISLGCLILASKVWEDQAVWNVDFLNVFPNLTVKDLNALEREVLNGLQFNVALKASVYAKYYFELRALSERDSQHFPLEPLNKEGQDRLEQRSLGAETSAKKKRITRSQSVESWSAPSPMASLPQ
jgi:hypothetical protein